MKDQTSKDPRVKGKSLDGMTTVSEFLEHTSKLGSLVVAKISHRASASTSNEKSKQ